jgi:hypothetical protein
MVNESINCFLKNISSCPKISILTCSPGSLIVKNSESHGPNGPLTELNLLGHEVLPEKWHQTDRRNQLPCRRTDKAMPKEIVQMFRRK